VIVVASKVYFIDVKSRKKNENLEVKLAKLFDKSGAASAISKGDLVAVKIHFGEPGNFRFIRPSHIRVIVDKIKELGAKPFITDTTGVGLTGGRGTAEKCLEAAAMHGYTPESLGAPIVVADGLKGFSGVKVKVNGLRLKEVEVAQAIAEADALVSLAHAKGHSRTGFGGALKNIGVGCLTKSGKAPLHLAMKPKIKVEVCNKCMKCVEFCPAKAIQLVDNHLKVIEEKCLWGCGCWTICPINAITSWSEMHHPRNSELSIRVADAASAIINLIGKDKVFFFNFAYDITPHCDCAAYADIPIVPDIGVLASKDPVAIDKASIDMINNSPGIPGSAVDELGVMEPGKDKLSALIDYPPFSYAKPQGGPDWKSMIEAAVKLGIGSDQYELIKVA